MNARTLTVIALMFTACLFGCQTESVTTSDGRPMPPEPRAITPPPSGTIPDDMMFLVGSKPTDSNGNGYPDLISITVALFARPHQTPLHAPGSFTFELYPMGRAGAPNVEPICSWTITAEEAALQRTRAVYGPCYQFEITLLDAGGDRFTLGRGDLVCRFQPDGDHPVVRNKGIRTIQIGRRGG